jgi:hypothetical protein
MEEEQKPTLENPFSDRQQRKFVPPPLFKPEPEPEPLYKPPYYVSHATLNFVAKQIEEGKLTVDELPLVHKLSLIIGKAMGRATPTVSDVEIASVFRSLEHVKKLAAGEETMDLVRHTPNQEVMPRKERVAFWKLLAQRVLDDYEAA